MIAHSRRWREWLWYLKRRAWNLRPGRETWLGLLSWWEELIEDRPMRAAQEPATASRFVVKTTKILYSSFTLQNKCNSISHSVKFMS